jgi:Lar family restriction alleviation protein
MEFDDLLIFSGNCFYKIEDELDTYGKYPPVIREDFAYRLKKDITILLETPNLLYKFLNYPLNKIKHHYSDEENVFEYIYVEYLSSMIYHIILLFNEKGVDCVPEMGANNERYKYIENLLLNGIKIVLPEEVIDFLTKESIKYLENGCRSGCYILIYLFCLLTCKNKSLVERIDKSLRQMTTIERIQKFKDKKALNDKIIESCPFCGNADHDPNSEVSYVIDKSDTGEYIQFTCSQCLATGPKRKDKKDALEAWNNRKNGDQSRCPFCGSSESFVKIFRKFTRHNNCTAYVAVCKKCESNGPYGKYEKDAYKEWSKRTSTS